MTRILPQGTDTLNNPSHSFQHRVVSVDTSSPQSSIDIDSVGNVTIAASIITPSFVGGSAAGSKITYKSTTGAGTAAGIAHQWVGGTNGGTVIATMLNSGNVGIGTTAPNALGKLHVAGNIVQDTNSFLYFGTANTAWINGIAGASGYLRFATNASEKMRITSAGNVGIGTTAPLSKLSINGGLHVGGDSDAGDNNLLVDGRITAPTIWATGLMNTDTIGIYNPNTTFTLNSYNYATANRFSITAAGGTFSQTSGTNGALKIIPTYNQVASTAANTDLLINRTETSLGSGAQYLIDAQVGGVSKFSVSNTGALRVANSMGILEGGATPSKYTIFQGGDQTVDITYTLPTAVGGAGTYLKDVAGDGVLSWATPTARTFGTGNVLVGTASIPGTATGINNVAVGEHALEALTSGGHNTTVGFNAGLQLTSAGSSALFGVNAGAKISTGDNNTFIGGSTGYFTGSSASTNNAVTTGTYNTFIGNQAGLNSPTQRTNATAIGNGAYVDADNTVVLGNAAVTNVLMGSTSLATIHAGSALISGNVGISTTSPTNILSLGGNAARIFWMERHTTSNTAGNTLTITAGGATAAATDKSGGSLILQGGLSTGTGESGVTIKGCIAGGSGTTDGTQSIGMQVLGNKIGFYGVTPLARAVLATGVVHTVDDVITALQNLGLVSQT